MTRYQKIYDQIKTTKKPIYSPYVMLGYPTAEKSFEVCRALIEQGVTSLELGLPFRDPAADGPVIQAAGIKALDNGFTTKDAIALVKRIRALSPDVGLLLMAYYNMVFVKGAEPFTAAFAEAGLDAILIPDLPPERADEIVPAARKVGLEVVFIASPLSTNDRLDLIAEQASGFIYVVPRLGITGVNDHYSASIGDLFDRIHKKIALPAIAGFGISEPEHATKMIAAGADGVITGTRLVQLIDEAGKDGGWDLTPVIKHTQAMLRAVAAADLKAA